MVTVQDQTRLALLYQEKITSEGKGHKFSGSNFCFWEDDLKSSEAWEADSKHKSLCPLKVMGCAGFFLGSLCIQKQMLYQEAGPYFWLLNCKHKNPSILCFVLDEVVARHKWHYRIHLTEAKPLVFTTDRCRRLSIHTYSRDNIHHIPTIWCRILSDYLLWRPDCKLPL